MYRYIYTYPTVRVYQKWGMVHVQLGWSSGVPNLLGCAHVGWGKDLALRLDGDLVTRADPLVSWPLFGSDEHRKNPKEENLPHFG